MKLNQLVLAVHVGNEPATIYEISNNSVCGYLFEGAGPWQLGYMAVQTYAGNFVHCTPVQVGRHLIVQNLFNKQKGIGINELAVAFDLNTTGNP